MRQLAVDAGFDGAACTFESDDFCHGAVWIRLNLLGGESMFFCPWLNIRVLSIIIVRLIQGFWRSGFRAA